MSQSEATAILGLGTEQPGYLSRLCSSNEEFTHVRKASGVTMTGYSRSGSVDVIREYLKIGTRSTLDVVVYRPLMTLKS